MLSSANLSTFYFLYIKFQFNKVSKISFIYISPIHKNSQFNARYIVR